MQVCTQDQDEEGHTIEGEPEVQVQMKPLSVRHSLLQKGNHKGREREKGKRKGGRLTATGSGQEAFGN